MYFNTLIKTTLFLLIVQCCCDINLPIGAIFEDDPVEDEDVVFRAAIDMLNDENPGLRYKFEALTENVAPEDVRDPKTNKTIGVNWDRPYPALTAACSLIAKGVVAMISPSYDNNANTIQSLCDSKEIPFVRVSPDRVHGRECCSINIFPHMPVLSKAAADLVMHWNWNNFTILFESYDDLANIAQLFKLYNKTGNSVTLFQLEKTEHLGYRESFMQIRSTGQTNFVLHCEIESLFEILQHAQQVGLIMKKYKFIILNLDMHTVDFELFQHSKINITGLRMVDPTHPNTIKLAQYMINKKIELGKSLTLNNARKVAWKIDIVSALIADAVRLLIESLKEIEDFVVQPLFCNLTDSWEHGSTIFNFMKMKSFDSLTGLMHFDQKAFRSDFSLDIIELRETGFIKIGDWNSKSELKINRPPLNDKKGHLVDTFLKVLICWSEPYAFYKNATKILKGNDQFEGFVVDIIRELSILEGFRYRLIRNEDDKNGDFNPITKKWNGMIGDILQGRGDIAIGDVAITKQRKEYVDFTTPFIVSGTQILIRKQASEKPNFFSFADPFDKEVWTLIGVSYFGISLMLYITSHISPLEWENYDPCIENPPYLVNQFNIRNSLWFMLGCLMQQGAADLAPRSTGTRVLSGVWGFFILIIVSYYKAQLAAFLTTEIKDLPFKNVEEFVRSTKISGMQYGAVTNETTHVFFQNSPIPLHQEIAHYMDTHPDNMVYDNYEGFLKVEKGNYAFFTDSVFAEFVTKVVCSMTTVGNPINEQHFAIALKKNSPYRGILSTAILKLIETGQISKLQKKWWDEKFRVGKCDDDEGGSNAVAPPLNLFNTIGIFGLTMGVILFACSFVFFELAVDIYLKNNRRKDTFIEEFKIELKKNLQFNETKLVTAPNREDNLPSENGIAKNLTQDCSEIG